MRRRYRILMTILSILLGGCYDIEVERNDHTITDLRILAIRAEPPLLRPDTPLVAEVLFADPNGKGKTINAVWGVKYLYESLESGNIPGKIVNVGGRANARLDLVTTEVPAWNDREEAPNLLLDLYLCRGELNEPERILSATDVELFENLCRNGPLTAGFKEVVPELPVDMTLGFGTSLQEVVGLQWRQQNPRIERVTVNDISYTALEDGGGTSVLCRAPETCGASIRLSAYLDPDSIDRFIGWGPNIDAGPLDPTDLADAGIEVERVEHNRVEWYVTAGTIEYPYSIPGIGVSDAGALFSTVWHLPDVTTYREYMLYAVVRDTRDGCGWKSFRFSVGERDISK